MIRLKNFSAIFIIVLLDLLLYTESVYAVVSISSKLAKVQKHIVDPSGDNTVYLIRDIHCHPKVQKNIAQILQAIQSTSPITLIGIEGSTNQVSFDVFRQYPNIENAKKACDFFIKNTDISGAEYFAATSLIQGNDIPVIGLENISLYEQNKMSLIQCISNAILLSTQVKALKQYTQEYIYSFISPSAKELLQIIYESDKNIPFGKLFSLLQKQNIDITPYPVISNYYTQWKILSEFNSKRLIEQTMDFVNRLQQNEPQIFTQLQPYLFNYMNGTITLTSLLQEVSRQSKHCKTKHYLPYITDYLTKYKHLTQIESNEIEQELPALFVATEHHIMDNKITARIQHLHTNLSIISKMLKLSLTPTEYISLRNDLINTSPDTDLSTALCSYLMTHKILIQYIADQDELASLFRPFFNFYETALKRDRIMGNTFLQAYNHYNQSDTTHTFVIIIGGFHQTGLSNYLTKNNINYTTITPQTDEDQAYDQTYYFKRLNASQSKFDIRLNKYLMSLQVWSNFSTIFPDKASKTYAELFQMKLKLFLYGVSDLADKQYYDWFNSVFHRSEIRIKIITQSHNGIVYSLRKYRGKKKNFFFEITFNDQGEPEFQYNQFYPSGLEALTVESNSIYTPTLSWQFYKAIIDENSLDIQSEQLPQFTRYLMMLRYNNPRLFYKASMLTAQKISGALRGSDASSIHRRTSAFMRFNRALDTAETAINFIQQGIIQWNELNQFLATRHDFFLITQEKFGSDDTFSMRLDLASKSAELSTYLLALEGKVPRNTLLDHYLSHLVSGLLRNNISDPTLPIPPASIQFVANLADRISNQTIGTVSTWTRLVRGDRTLTHLPDTDYQYYARLAEFAVREFNPEFRVSQQFHIKEPIPDIESLYQTVIHSISSKPERLLFFLENILAEDLLIIQPLQRSANTLGRDFSSNQITALLESLDRLLPQINDQKLDITNIFYLRALLRIKIDDLSGAKEDVATFIEHISKIDFSQIPQKLDAYLHKISALSKLPVITKKQREQLETLYDSLSTLSGDITESDWVDFGAIQQKDIVLSEPTQALNGTGRVIRLNPADIVLHGISEETFRLYDMSKFSYLPYSPGYIYTPRPGKTLQEMVDTVTQSEHRPLLAAINGANSDWASANAFVIINNKFINKPVPGTHQKEHTPISGIFNIIGFDKHNKPTMQTVEIKFDELVGKHDIKWAIPGPAILKDKKIFPALTVRDSTSATHKQELGFLPSESEIRSSFSAMGISESGEILLTTITGAVNLPAMANILRNAGAKNAIILGGSGDAQLISFGAKPILAKERQDKILREDTEKIRHIGQGMLFFSKTMNRSQLNINRLRYLWKQDRRYNEHIGSIGIITLLGTKQDILNLSVKQQITATLQNMFYVEEGTVIGDLSTRTTQHIFLREKLQRGTVLKKLGFDQTTIEQKLAGRSMYKLDTQDFITMFILDPNIGVLSKYPTNSIKYSSSTIQQKFSYFSEQDILLLQNFIAQFSSIPSPNKKHLNQQLILEKSL